MEQGTQAGVFEEEEQDLVERVFWLGDQRVVAVMTPRHRIVWLDVNAPFSENRAADGAATTFRATCCAKGALDRVLGIVEVKRPVVGGAGGRARGRPAAVAAAPLFIPESTRALTVLERFRESGTHMAVVVDEYGGLEGLVTLNDILEEIAGSMAHGEGGPAAPVVRRDDGSLLVDASLSIEEFRELLDLEDRRHEPPRIPDGGRLRVHAHRPRSRTRRALLDAGYRIEVVDMDGNRVDKMLVAPTPEPRDLADTADDSAALLGGLTRRRRGRGTPFHAEDVEDKSEDAERGQISSASSMRRPYLSRANVVALPASGRHSVP